MSNIERKIQEIIIEHAKEVLNNNSLYCGKKCPSKIKKLIRKLIIESCPAQIKNSNSLLAVGLNTGIKQYKKALLDGLEKENV